MSHSQVPSTLRPFNAMRGFRSISGLVRSKASRTGAASAYEFVARGIVLDTTGMKERTSFCVRRGSRCGVGVPEFEAVPICVVASSSDDQVLGDIPQPDCLRLEEDVLLRAGVGKGDGVFLHDLGDVPGHLTFIKNWRLARPSQ